MLGVRSGQRARRQPPSRAASQVLLYEAIVRTSTSTRAPTSAPRRFALPETMELNARVTIRTKDQRVFVKEQLGYEGGLANPLSWDRTVEKFHWLSEAFADADLRHALVRAVQQLDTRPLFELMDLLAQVRPNAAFPTAHPGVQ
jgi:hypothetical protein